MQKAISIIILFSDHSFLAFSQLCFLLKQPIQLPRKKPCAHCLRPLTPDPAALWFLSHDALSAALPALDFSPAWLGSHFSPNFANAHYFICLPAPETDLPPKTEVLILWLL